MPIPILLTRYEYDIATYIGIERHTAALNQGRKDQHGLGLGWKDPLRCHIEGVAGEIACARALNVYWPPSVNTFKLPDLSHDIQVKTRGEHWYDLLVRPDDDPNHLYVLVTTSPDQTDLEYRVHGYLSGRESKKVKYWQTYGNRDPAYFPLQDDLHPFDDLLKLILDAQIKRIGIELPLLRLDAAR